MAIAKLCALAVVLSIVQLLNATRDITCADQETKCPDNTTCCQLSDGGYGCCPMPSAVCCSDHEHCCPHGTVCDLEHETCNKPDGESVRWQRKQKRIPWINKRPSVNTAQTRTQTCPDGVSRCPDQMTCCASPTSGEYGCCPIEKAVCCDEQHCCPEGAKCDPLNRACIVSVRQVLLDESWRLLKPAAPVRTNYMCPDHLSQCGDYQTCCISPDGFKCCPIRNATCCSDFMHCCPEGYTCKPQEGHCIPKGDGRQRFIARLQALRPLPPFTLPRTLLQKEVTYVQCADQVTQCPDKTTCCELADGSYGCCPYQRAVCCSDKEHCCPEGSTCNLEQQTCDKRVLNGDGVVRMRWSQHQPGISTDSSEVTTTPCDDGATSTKTCPSSTTCCRTTSVSVPFACCPFTNGQCCRANFCCPAGWSCHHDGCRATHN